MAILILALVICLAAALAGAVLGVLLLSARSLASDFTERAGTR